MSIMGLTREIANELRDTGTYTNIGAHPYSWADASGLYK
jgi:hypothetical protein